MQVPVDDLSQPHFSLPEGPGLRLPRIAIVGTGHVGSTTAYALLISGMAAEIILVGRNRQRTEGHVQDLRDAEVFSHRTCIYAGDLVDCCSADITIITTGVSQAGSKSRLDGMKETAMILKGIVGGFAQRNPRGILLIASNPVDVLTYAAWKWSELPANRVIGSGTSLDTARFRRRLAEKLGVASGNVHAYILGEHGECQFPVVSSARIAGVPLAEFCNEMGSHYDAGALGAIADETRRAGASIIRAKGATYYGIGAALVRIVCAILRDEHSVFTVSTLVPEFLRLGAVSLSLPIILSREGVHRVLPISMNASERQAFEACAETQKRHINLLNGLTNS